MRVKDLDPKRLYINFHGHQMQVHEVRENTIILNHGSYSVGNRPYFKEVSKDCDVDRMFEEMKREEIENIRAAVNRNSY